MKQGKNEPSSNAWSNSKRDQEEQKEEYFDVDRGGSYFRDQNSEMNLESIVSTPIVAISKANSLMLSGQLTFLLEYCFTKSKEDKGDGEGIDKIVYIPQMINLSLKSKGTEKDAEEKTTIIPIPIITLLPISSIGLEKMKIDFSMEVTSVSSYKNVRDGVLERKAQLSGKISSIDKYRNPKAGDNNESPSNRMLNVSMEANKLPLPVGILNIIDMMNKVASL